MREFRLDNSVVRIDPLLVGAGRAEGVCVLIDVFRAATTACAILSQNPATYLVAASDEEVENLAARIPDALRVGKPDLSSKLMYHVPNSPSLALGQNFAGRVVIHKSAAGGRGAVMARRATRVFIAGFANLRATARQLLNEPLITLVPLGHEGTRPAPEDELCADGLLALLGGGELPDPIHSGLEQTSGRYFFDGNESEYPRSDFAICLDVDQYDFAVLVTSVGALGSSNLNRAKINP